MPDMDGPEKEKSLDYFAQILSFFHHRGIAIFNCGEAFLLRMGLSYQDIDRIGVVASNKYYKGQSPREKTDNFKILVTDLDAAGFSDAARFVEEYYESGSQNVPLKEYLDREGLHQREVSLKGKPVKKSPEDGERAVGGDRKETESSSMNLLTNYEETVRRLREMEGEEWFKSDDSSGKYSIPRAKAEAEVGRGSTIYGAGGGNRYVVSEDGIVYFSSRQESKSGETERARKIGFPII